VCLSEKQEQHMQWAIPISQQQDFVLQVSLQSSWLPLQYQGLCCKEAWQGVRASKHSGCREGTRPHRDLVISANRHDVKQEQGIHRKLVGGECHRPQLGEAWTFGCDCS
jgi:hypothetical protein